MPEEDVQNPASGGAGEATDTTAPQVVPEAPTPETPKEPSDDPLDEISDPVARAEAKKFRAIARRQEKPEAPAQAPSKPVAPVADKTVTFMAKSIVSAEVKEHWDELMSIPLSGYDASDPESIAQNMTDRLAILRSRPAKQNPAKDLSTSTVVNAKSGTAPAAETKTVFPRPLDVDAQAERLYGKS